MPRLSLIVILLGLTTVQSALADSLTLTYIGHQRSVQRVAMSNCKVYLCSNPSEPGCESRQVDKITLADGSVLHSVWMIDASCPRGIPTGGTPDMMVHGQGYSFPRAFDNVAYQNRYYDRIVFREGR